MGRFSLCDLDISLNKIYFSFNSVENVTIWGLDGDKGLY